jgi:hypothetical protein
MADNSSDWKLFVPNGFYVIKGIESGNIDIAEEITPTINQDNLDIEIIPNNNSVQSFNLIFNDKQYTVTVRTNRGCGFAELPSLKLTIS